VWSALEYACHVRDVVALQRERVTVALSEDNPTFEPAHPEQRVVRDRYNEQDPEAVADAVAANADALANLASELTAAQRTRLVTYAVVGTRTLDWVLAHTIHEGEHHLLDVGRVLRAARGR
jgi:DinB superfamily